MTYKHKNIEVKPVDNSNGNWAVLVTSIYDAKDRKVAFFWTKKKAMQYIVEVCNE